MNTLVINPIGGLANRMRAIAAGISLAGELDMDFRIIWSVDSDLYARFDAIFEIPDILKGKIVYPGQLDYALRYSIPRKKNLFLSSLFLRRFGKKLLSGTKDWLLTSGEDDTEIVRFFAGAQNSDAYIQGGTNFFSYKPELFRSLFIPVKQIRDEVAAVTGRMGESRVGVHIRRTDNHESISHSPLEVFVEKIRSVLEENPGMKIYLATDSESVKSEMKSIFKDSLFCDDSPASRTTEAGIHNAVREMYVLSSCQTIYGSYYSSYSEAAAMLGDIPLVTLFRP